MQETELTPVEEGKAVNNIHGAIVTTVMTYGGQLPKPGHVWYQYSVNRQHISVGQKQKGRATKYAVNKERKIGAFQIEKAFETEHGVQNVKNMIIVNILNKQKFFK